MPATSSYKDQLTLAAQELRQLLIEVKGGRGLERLAVSPSTDALLQFRSRYQARLTARVTMDQAEFRDHLRQDLVKWLNSVLAVLDALQATGSDSKDQIDERAAADRYNVRRRALDRFLDHLFTARVPYVEGEQITDRTPRIVASLKGKSEREIFQAISRTVPIEPGLDAEITSLLYGLTRSAHAEPTIEQLVTKGNDLTEPFQEETLRNFASSQGLRDFVGPYLAALIKKALGEEGVEAFDDAFRNTYFAVVNRVQNYYQSLPATEATHDVRSTKYGPTNEPATTLELAKASRQPAAPDVRPASPAGRRTNQEVRDKPKSQPVKGTGLE